MRILHSILLLSALLIGMFTFIAACDSQSTGTSQPDMISPALTAGEAEPSRSPDNLTPAATDAVNAPLRFSSDCAIMIEGVQILSGDRISVYGLCHLPESACIVTQVLDDDQPLAWWQSGACVTIEDGKWHIEMPLVERNLVAQGYMVYAWERGNPAVAPAKYPFSVDLIGGDLQVVPPSLESPDRPVIAGALSGLLNDDRATIRVYGHNSEMPAVWGERANGLWELAIHHSSIDIGYYTVTAAAEGYRAQPSQYTIATDCKTAHIVRDSEIGEEAIDLDFQFTPNKP